MIEPFDEQSLANLAVRPEQFYETSQAGTVATGERALMRAVLEDAIKCYQQQFITSKKSAIRLAKEAEEWIFANDHEWPFSFKNVCQALNLEPEYLHSNLVAWEKRRPLLFKKSRLRNSGYSKIAA